MSGGFQITRSFFSFYFEGWHGPPSLAVGSKRVSQGLHIHLLAIIMAGISAACCQFDSFVCLAGVMRTLRCKIWGSWGINILVVCCVLQCRKAAAILNLVIMDRYDYIQVEWLMGLCCHYTYCQNLFMSFWRSCVWNCFSGAVCY